MDGNDATASALTNLVNNFLPAQILNAINNGLNPTVYAGEVMGLAWGSEATAAYHSGCILGLPLFRTLRLAICSLHRRR